MRRLAILGAVMLWAAPPASADTPAKAKAPEVEQIVRVEHRPAAAVPILGPAQAPVTFEFFANISDHSRTANAYYRLRELAARHPNRLRIIVRLVSRAGRSDYNLEAAREAFVQGRFFEFLDAFYGDLRRTPRRQKLPEIAAAAGVDFARIQQAWKDHRHADRIRENYWRARRFRVIRTPGLLVNGRAFDRIPRDLESLEEIYDSAFADARKLLRGGIPLSELYDHILTGAALAEPLVDLDIHAVDGFKRRGGPKVAHPGRLTGKFDLVGTHRRGDESAPLLISLFCSLESRNCADLHRILSLAELAFKGQLRVSYHHLFDPSEQTHAQLLAEAAECAAEQGAFWPFVESIYNRYQSRNHDIDSIKSRADKLRLDSDSLVRCLTSGRHAESVAQSVLAARRAGVRYSPSLVIGGRVYIGTRSFDELRSVLSAELAPGWLSRLVPR